MCIDQRTSLNSFIFSVCISIFLIFLNKQFDVGNAAFIISFTTIQLLEYYIWKSIDNNNKSDNEYYTRLVPLVLFIQPIVQTYFSWKITNNNLLFNLLIVYILIFLFTLTTINNFEYQSEVGENKHLIWYKTKVNFSLPLYKTKTDKTKVNPKEKTIVIQRFIFGYIYLLGLGIGLYFTQQYTLLLYGILSFMYIWKNYPEDEFSSMWCFVAIYYSILALMINF